MKRLVIATGSVFLHSATLSGFTSVVAIGADGGAVSAETFSDRSHHASFKNYGHRRGLSGEQLGSYGWQTLSERPSGALQNGSNDFLVEGSPV